MQAAHDPDLLCGEQWLSSDDLRLVDEAVSARDAEIVRLEAEATKLEVALVTQAAFFQAQLERERKAHDETRLTLDGWRREAITWQRRAEAVKHTTQPPAPQTAQEGAHA